MNLGKTRSILGVVFEEAFGRPGPVPITRVAVVAVLKRPVVGAHRSDRAALFQIGGALGLRFAPRAAAHPPHPPVSDGEAALVGAARA